MPEAAAEESPAEKEQNNTDAAEKAKAAGREAFQKQEWEEAIKMYTEAIDLNDSDHISYSNRSGAYAGLSDKHKENKDDAARVTALTHALEDGQKCVSLRPDFTKGYGRVGYAFFYLDKYEEAKQAYEKGLEQDPASEVLKKGLKDVEEYSVRGQSSQTQASSTKPRRSGLKGAISKLVNPLDLSAKGATLYAVSVIVVITLIVLYRAQQNMASGDANAETDGDFGGDASVDSDL
jgi:tetratricopeptide (TPR) repeat protein